MKTKYRKKKQLIARLKNLKNKGRDYTVEADKIKIYLYKIMENRNE